MSDIDERIAETETTMNQILTCIHNDNVRVAEGRMAESRLKENRLKLMQYFGD